MMTLEDMSDEALMAAYVGGDHSAFRTLFDRYAPRLLGLMQRQISREADARDLVQQTFMQLHRARNDFRKDAALRPWLFTIALNLRREHFRKKGRRKEASLDLDVHQPSVAPDPRLERMEAAGKVREALQQLPEKQRVVIELHWLEVMSVPEVSRVVGAKLSAVKVRAHRGYERLRKILGPYHRNQ